MLVIPCVYWNFSRRSVRCAESLPSEIECSEGLLTFRIEPVFGDYYPSHGG